MSAGYYHLRLAGVSHYQDALLGCSEGEPVRLFHEPDNPHDALAIRVESRWGELIGYVPRTNWLRRAIFQDGRGASAAIAGIGRGQSGYIGAVISIAVTDDEVGLRSYYPGRTPPEPPVGGYRFWLDANAEAACERSAA